MISAWWQLNMDARRVLSMVVGIPGVTLIWLSIAASRGFPGFSGGIESVFTFAFGYGTGAYLTHREAEPERRLLWAIGYGSLGLATSGSIYVAHLILSPVAERYPTLADASVGIAVIGTSLLSIAAALWERDPHKRAVTSRQLFVIAIAYVGFVAVLDGGAWFEIGALMLTVGVIAILIAIVRRLAR